MRSVALKLYHSQFGQALSRAGFGKSKFVRKIYGQLISIKPLIVDVEGHKMLLDKTDSLNLLSKKAHDEFEKEFVKKQINKGDTILDIGANIGYMTLIIAREVGKKGKVYAFEPDHENFKILEKNVKLNKYTNVELINKAVSDKNSETKLFLSEYNSGDHRLANPNNDRKAITIQTLALDEFFKYKNEKIDVIKMDIQGSEALALRGMKQLIKKNKDLKIILEFWPLGLHQAQESPKKLLEDLKREGFQIYDLDKKEKKAIPVTIPEILAKVTLEKRNFANLFCRRE